MKDPAKTVHADTSEAALVNEVHQRGKGDPNAWLAERQMDITRRNNDALRAFNASSDRWSRRLFWLTLVLTGLTVVLMALTWALLEHGG